MFKTHLVGSFLMNFNLSLLYYNVVLINKNMERSINGFDCSNVDDITFMHLQEYNDNCIKIGWDVVKFCAESVYMLDKEINKSSKYLDPRGMCWGVVLDKIMAENLHKYARKGNKFHNCINHNIDRDIVCENNHSLDTEVKSSLNGGIFYFSRPSKNSTKYKNYDEHDFHILISMNRTGEHPNIKTTIKNIWLGRICPNDITDGGQLLASVRDKKCINIF